MTFLPTVVKEIAAVVKLVTLLLIEAGFLPRPWEKVVRVDHVTPGHKYESVAKWISIP